MCELDDLRAGVAVPFLGSLPGERDCGNQNLVDASDTRQVRPDLPTGVATTCCRLSPSSH